MADETPERNVFIFSRIPMAGDGVGSKHTFTILEYDDHFEVHTSDDPHGQPEIFEFEESADKWERYRMATQLINIYLTTPTIEED